MTNIELMYAFAVAVEEGINSIPFTQEMEREQLKSPLKFTLSGLAIIMLASFLSIWERAGVRSYSETLPNSQTERGNGRRVSSRLNH